VCGTHREKGLILWVADPNPQAIDPGFQSPAAALDNSCEPVAAQARTAPQDHPESNPREGAPRPEDHTQPGVNGMKSAVRRCRAGTSKRHDNGEYRPQFETDEALSWL
jgi:hypothetical protein